LEVGAAKILEIANDVHSTLECAPEVPELYSRIQKSHLTGEEGRKQNIDRIIQYFRFVLAGHQGL